MNPLLSAKGSDVTTWRAVENFTAAYQQALLDQAASGRADTAESVFLDAQISVEAAIATHRELLNRLHSLIEEVAVAPPTTSVRGLTTAFYSDLYRYFGHVRSATAFYQLSMAYLRQASATVIAQTKDALGTDSEKLSDIALIAIGPAGRLEYTPFCPLQLLLVHGEAAAAHPRIIDQFCISLHAGFEGAGLAIDPDITPQNTPWRGTIKEWRQRCDDGVKPNSDEESISLGRLADQYLLYRGEGLDPELKKAGCAALKGNRPAVAHLVSRMGALSNGLGLMGRLKLERSGSERGLFRLLDHGLLPLSAALSAVSLIREISVLSSCDRINDLLKMREIDVELAERMLATWHTLHGLRLQREQSFPVTEQSSLTTCLDPDELTAEQRQSLKEALESVAIIQRHVEIIFSGMEG